MHPDYDVVIGLEVHVQLRTRTKLFSTAGVSYGEAPNHHTTPVCLALPGALPVLNGEAVDLAIRAGIATNCEVHPTSIFARKNYFQGLSDFPIRRSARHRRVVGHRCGVSG